MGMKFYMNVASYNKNTCILSKFAYRSSLMKLGETLDCFLADMALWNSQDALKLGCTLCFINIIEAYAFWCFTKEINSPCMDSTAINSWHPENCRRSLHICLVYQEKEKLIYQQTSWSCYRISKEKHFI